MTLNEIITLNKTDCDCKKIHKSCLDGVIIENGAICKLANAAKRYDAKKAFLLSDPNTYEAAGKMAQEILKNGGIEVVSYVLPDKKPKPDEKSVGSVIMHYDSSCDIIIAAGSGVINDIGKILASTADKPYIIVATAPSVDGYASSTSSMDRDGLKISLNSKCANIIIGDIDILKNAPLKMLRSGLGDMLAKYTALCEWRISSTVTDEYYCEYVASLVRYATKRCIDNADRLLSRDDEAVKAVFEGLIISGLAMNFAGCSRPASGVEHYFSHLWDMRALEFGAPAELHGLQCASGFLSATQAYTKLKAITPCKEKALASAKNFNVNEWNSTLREFLGKGAEPMINVGVIEKRYDTEAHIQRLDKIINKWNDILLAIDEELLPLDEAKALFKRLDMPDIHRELSLDEDQLILTFKATKDIRAKYILSTLLWDIGELENPALLSALK